MQICWRKTFHFFHVCVIIGGRAIQLSSLGSFTVNDKNLIYICSRRLIKVPDPKENFLYTERIINEFSTQAIV